ncbi:MAG: NAD-dependent epimerase/dehydratase family protein [Chitinophagales bacterium]
MKEQLILIQKDCEKSCADISSLNSLRNQSILITGGTGFVGKWIAEMICYLNEKENFNIKLYLLSRNVELFKTEVPHLAKKSYVNLIEQDVRNIYEIPNDIQWVVNAAGSPDSKEHSSQPIKTIETFTKGTTSLFESCFRLPDLKKIVHLSSHQVYGKINSEKPIDEKQFGSLDAYNLNSIYAESKRLTETYCAIYRNQYRMPIIIARPFAFIGPYQSLNKHWAVNSFIRDGLFGDSIRILGDGNTVRSYLYGSDMAYWILSMLSNGISGECYNLGSSERINLIELANKIVNLLNRNIKINSKSSKESYDNTSIIVPDLSKVFNQLKIEVNIDIDFALMRTIQSNKK